MNIGKTKWFFDQSWFVHDHMSDLVRIGYDQRDIDLLYECLISIKLTDIMEICSLSGREPKDIMIQYTMKGGDPV